MHDVTVTRGSDSNAAMNDRCFETIAPDQLRPANLYDAQLERGSGLNK